MIVDTSAVLAILQSEPERHEFIEALHADASRAMSVASYVECSIVLSVRRGPDAVRDLDLFISKLAIQLVPVDLDQAMVARHAHRKFGKGIHAAGLNYGDCFSYALSQVSGEPLLYKGRDFSLTDVERHPASR